MRSTKMILWLVALLGLTACGQETPVELGGLIPGGGIRTAEMVFDASAFLEWDSVRTGFLQPVDADFMVAAAGYEGGLDAHSLFRLQAMPRTVAYNDTLGTLRVDSLPALVSGRLALRVDTLRAVASEPVQVAVYRVDEAWDPRSVNWSLRVDTGSVQLAWAEPGGTKADLINSAHHIPGDSVLNFDVDAAALELLRDSTVNNLGLLVQVQTPGARLEFTSAWLHFTVRPSARPDTLISDSVSIGTKTFMLSSAPDPTNTLLMGGVPTWRTYLKFQDRLDTLAIPCPGSSAGCTLRLGDAVLNYAAVELQPVTGSPGFALLDTVFVEPRTVLPLDGVPLARAPLGVQIGGFAAIPPTAGPGLAASLEVPITPLIASLAGDSLARANAPRIMTLLGSPEGESVGLGAFGSLAAGPLAPRLRLIYSVTKEVQDQ